MPAQNFDWTRRAFPGHTLALGAGAVLLGASAPVKALENTIRVGTKSAPVAVLPEFPTRVLIQQGDNRFAPDTRRFTRRAFRRRGGSRAVTGQT